MFNFLKTDFYGDLNIGLHGFATDDYCFIGPELQKAWKTKIEKLLNTKIHSSTIAGTSLVGIFSTGNSNGILLPKITEPDELKKIKSLFPKLNITILDSKETALGNLILCNNQGVIVSPKLSFYKDQIEDALGVPAEVSTLADLHLVGSTGVASNRGCLVHRDSTEEEIKTVESTLKVKVDVGTTNYGSPFVKAGVIVNSNGVLVSESSTGPELGRIMEVFE